MLSWTVLKSDEVWTFPNVKPSLCVLNTLHYDKMTTDPHASSARWGLVTAL